MTYSGNTLNYIVSNITNQNSVTGTNSPKFDNIINQINTLGNTTNALVLNNDICLNLARANAAYSSSPLISSYISSSINSSPTKRVGSYYTVEPGTSISNYSVPTHNFIVMQGGGYINVNIESNVSFTITQNNNNFLQIHLKD